MSRRVLLDVLGFAAFLVAVAVWLPILAAL